MMPPPRVLLCCEAGQGRGHVTTLATVARALAPEARSQAILAQSDHGEIMDRVCDRVDRGMGLAPLPGAPPSPVMTWAGWLRVRGFSDPDDLRRRFDWWCEAMDAIRPALVVADFGPTALLAARARGIATVATGAAFGLPPATLERFPNLLTPAQDALHGTVRPDAPPPDEAAICDTINAVLGPLGLPPLARLAEVYAADLSLPRGVAWWDPYDGLRDRPLLLPVDPVPPLQTRRGSEVVIYFSTGELGDPATLEALERLPYDAVLVGTEPSPDQARALARNPRLRLAHGLLSQAEIARRARVVICAGQAGTLALAVLAGVPVLALPQQHEQLSNALRAATHLGSVRALPKVERSADAILEMLDDLWARDGVAVAARLMAQDLRADYAESAEQAYRRLLRPLLQGAG